jgi:flagellin-like hook-associated protein FlgL
MGMSVNTNIAALNSYRNLSTTNNQMSKSLERLSSGFRINRAADDAAGLAISEGLRSQIGGMTQAVRNTQDGTSVVQTAEGALNETTSILQRMRDLSVQASNDGSLNTDAKGSIQKEIGQLKEELSRIAATTNFNGTKLLDGNFAKSFQVGANAGETISVGIGSVGKGMDATGLGVGGVDVAGVGKYSTASVGGADALVVSTDATDSAAATMVFTAYTDDDGNTDDFSDANKAFDSFSRLSGTISFGGKVLDLSSVQYDKSADTDGSGTADSADLLAQLNKAAISAFGLTGLADDGTQDPFTTDGGSLTFSVVTAVDGYTGTGGVALGDADPDDIDPSDGTTLLSPSAPQVASATPKFTAGSGAKDALKAIDAAIKTVSSVRADLGAIQNRFDHTINNLNVAIENTTASESRIRDTDMAAEMTNFSRTQILTQAGTSMLAQANQSSQGILKLLG